VKFEIFRRSDARTYAEEPVMYVEATTTAASEGWPKVHDAGYMEGNEVKLLFSAAGFSLTYVWFKSGLPLPLHSHDVDCLYYIISGSLKLGSDLLGAGDGFFVGRDVPYAYVPGEKGLEILEFRTSNRFNIRFLASNPSFWEKAAEQVRGRRTAWATEERPSQAISAASEP
jgi:hypothetical protein